MLGWGWPREDDAPLWALRRNHTKHLIVGNMPTLTSCKKKKSRTKTIKDLLINMLHLSLEDKLTINNDTIKNVLTEIDKKN